METEAQHIRIKAVIEILGKPKDFIEKRMKDYIERLKEDDNLMVLKENISDAEEQEAVWAAFAEIELVIKGLPNLIGFCIDYMPSSIEIIKPEKFDFDQRIFTNFINDTLAKLHNTDMIAKKLGTENRVLKKNMNHLIRNNLLVLIKLGINKPEDLSKATGVDNKELKRFLDKLTEEKRIKEENNIYSILK